MIWLTGSNGMLGKEFVRKMEKLNLDFVSTDLEVNITNSQSIKDFLKDKNVKYIINCAAYTNVDNAEIEKDKAYEINVKGVENLSKAANLRKAVLIHFSTDYVYSGVGQFPFYEDDEVKPANYYGETKRLGENAALFNNENTFVFRLSWLYSFFGKNFPKTVLNLINEKDEIKVVNDQIGSPTYGKNVAYNVLKIISKNYENYGIYNFSDLGFISWYEFAVYLEKLYFENGITKKRCNIVPISTSEFKTKAIRPKNSRMDKSKLVKNFNVNLNDWKVNLEDFVSEIKYGKEK